MPALVTPLDDDGQLDRVGLDRLLDHILATPLAGIAPAGSTGEGPLLTQALRLALTKAVRERLTDEQWLVPGVPAPSAEAAIAEIKGLVEAGADAVLLPPPWYYPLGPREIVHYFGSVADASPLPIVLYNIPRLTKVSIDPEVVAELASHPMIIGMKDSSGDLEHLARTASEAGLPVLTGSDATLLDALHHGASGCIGASVNVVPDAVQAIYAAHASGRIGEAENLQKRVADVVAACSAAGFPAGWKAALEILGVCRGRPAHPLRPIDVERMRVLAAALAES
jgi:dihydrodipicolinate synthase/N-acetylneuraminate lyase